ncbi:MAG TPA: 2-oxo acid dehydrogenase subunit E2 [Planctomycetota bacterium]|nr:2-oxo acid dehydrogenase subunit E2 [Planctomycetota bacterium]HQB00171.1 2-oxo acid dehydrogenase subunit E2 [Planctomycetota bacterium]
MSLQFLEREVYKNPSNFRKAAIGAWHGIGDPQVYAVLDVDCSEILKYIEEIRREKGIHLTINHIVAKILAMSFRKYPQINGLIARGKIYLRKSVDAFLHVSIEGAETELVGICIRNADKKSIFQVAEEIRIKSEKVRNVKEHPIRKSQNIFRILPWRMIPFIMHFINWLQYDCNIHIPFLKLPRDPFGSFMLTSVGSLGVKFTLNPLSFLGRSSMVVSVGKITKIPVVLENDEIAVRPYVNICITFDHRFMDGLVGAKMAHFLLDYLRNIYKYRDELEKDKLPTLDDQQVSEKIEIDTLENQPALEKIDINTLENQPVSEKIETDTLENQPTLEKIDINTLENQPASENASEKMDIEREKVKAV